MSLMSSLNWLNPVYNGTQVGNAIGSAIGQFNNAAVTRQEAFNSAEAQKQRDFEERMSNTAIQRQVADLKAAGLNPWLAVQNGANGAAVPSGASASSNSAMAQVAGTVGYTGMIVKSITSMASSAMHVIGNLAKLAAAS